MKKQFQTKKIALAVALSLGASLVVAQSGPIKIGVVTPLSGTYTPIEIGRASCRERVSSPV